MPIMMMPKQEEDLEGTSFHRSLCKDTTGHEVARSCRRTRRGCESCRNEDRGHSFFNCFSQELAEKAKKIVEIRGEVRSWEVKGKEWEKRELALADEAEKEKKKRKQAEKELPAEREAELENKFLAEKEAALGKLREDLRREHEEAVRRLRDENEEASRKLGGEREEAEAKGKELLDQLEGIGKELRGMRNAISGQSCFQVRGGEVSSSTSSEKFIPHSLQAAKKSTVPSAASSSPGTPSRAGPASSSRRGSLDMDLPTPAEIRDLIHNVIPSREKEIETLKEIIEGKNAKLAISEEELKLKREELEALERDSRTLEIKREELEAQVRDARAAQKAIGRKYVVLCR